ncbi:MAG: sugar ABC transporter permease [Proteobacteria bacterium]|nr:sugar ABC transporter permease [Pseudomonadota bacterium]
MDDSASTAAAGDIPAPSFIGERLERWVETHLRYLMLAPAVLILAGLTLFPTFYMFTLSFQKFNPGVDVPNEWIGLGNFARLLTDEKFHNALGNTLFFTGAAVGIEFVLGLSFALLVDKYIRRLNFIKTILMLPMMLPPVAVAITWKLIYQPQFGVLNDFLFRLGLPTGVWTSGADSAMWAIIFVDIWEWTPFIFLMMLAGIASLPEEPYEAADLDGASAWQKFRDLTWPFLRPVVTIALLLRLMDALRLFDQVFILTRGGPASVTETLSLYIFRVALRFQDIGYAAAMSLFVLFSTIVLSTWFIRRMQMDDSKA